MNYRNCLRRTYLFFWIAIFWLFINASKPISADVIWVRAQATPIFGRVISSSPDQIEFQVFENGKFGPIEKLSRSNIEQQIVNIDNQRLEKLHPSRPAAYRDYAEELASQRSDPAARSLAKRLFLIAAANAKGSDAADKQLCNSSLSGLVSIAETEAERQRINVLRFMTTPDADPLDIYSPPKRTKAVTRAQTELMLKLVRAIRQEDSATATKLLNSQADRAAFRLWSDTCSLEELDRIAKVNRPSKPQLSRLVQIELQILAETTAANFEGLVPLTKDRKLDWGDFSTQGTSILNVVPSFENVTTMDPRKSVFRNGHWQRPDATLDQ